MPIMYGPDGQKEWVWPWQVEQRSAEGWTAEQPGVVARRPGQPAHPVGGFISPLEEARRALEQVQEPAILSNRGFTPAMAKVSVGQPYWVGTDINGRPIYEVAVSNAAGESASVRRYALDTTSTRGFARFVPAAASLDVEMPSTEVLVETRNEQTGISPDLSTPIAATMRLLLSGAITDENARAKFAGLGLAPEAINLLLNPPTGGGRPVGWWEDYQLRHFGDQLGATDIPQPESEESVRASILSAIFGSGSGGGPRYQAPDRELVRDSVRGTLIALVGVADPGRIETLTDLYLRDHRRAFSGASVDPSQSVRSMIRGYNDYQRLHQLRPDQVDETDWIPSQAARLVSSGVRSSSVDERAMIQAQIGTPLAEAGDAAAISEFQATGRPLPAFFQKFRDQASLAMRRVG